MSVSIHPTAVVSREAELDEEVVIGPFCVVGGCVRLGKGTKLLGSCTIEGPTSLGSNNTVHPYAVLGAEPQDRSHRGDPTRLMVGDDNVFREQVTVHRGTLKDQGVTRIGSRCLLMVGAHVAHDSWLEDDVTLANGTQLAGHSRVASHVTTGGLSALAPFVRVGRCAFVAAGSMVEQDVPPFVIVAGDRARVRALNRVGLARMGVPEESQRALVRAFRVIYRGQHTRSQALDHTMPDDLYVSELLAFLRARQP